MLIVGDLNINSLNYKSNESAKNFFNLVFQSGFLPLILRPTGVTKTTVTTIDHIITDTILKNKIQSEIVKTNISDHFPIFPILKTSALSFPEAKRIKTLFESNSSRLNNTRNHDNCPPTIPACDTGVLWSSKG